jgi:hypothetical protein
MIPRREVRDVASREVVPVSEWPNFRDHGRMVDTPLLNLLSKLQQKHGRSWASEGGLRTMICEDTGHMPGTTTIPKALKRLGMQGLVVNVHLVAGDIKPDGEVCTHGTREVWVPRTDKQRRAAKAYNARPGRAPYRSQRHTGFDARALAAKIGAAERPSMPPSPIESYRARRDEQVAKLRALEALWSEDDKAKRDKGPGPPE